ncbi:hypothetical protein D3C83_189400 [compost metagenome]
MAGRGDKSKAESLEIIEGVVQCMNLQLASVTGAGVDLPDRQRPAKFLARGLVEALGEFRQFAIVQRRTPLGQRGQHEGG